MGNMRFKVGDRVRIKSLDWYNENKTIHGDIWFDNSVFVGGQSLYCGCELTIRLVTNDSYHVIENDYYWTDEMIEGLVEEEEVSYDIESEWLKHEISLPEGYIFKDENGNVINATKIVLEKKKKEYPKTFLECCDVLNIGNLIERGVKGYKAELFDTLQKLYICRDAYWKIAGEEMELGKPWEPNWEDEHQEKYIIGSWLGTIQCLEENFVSHPFAFPTSEMRDVFYENFKELINSCKELL